MTLKEKVDALPETPGVYFHNGLEPKVRAMIDQVADVDVLQTPTEVDALIAEARLVKDTQPKYNIQLKDDKSFAMLAITRFDDFPKVWTVWETDEVDAELMGPFLSSGDLREAVKVLQKIFKFATCRIEMHEDDEKRRYFRPCLLHAIGRCTAPCAARISKEDYAANIGSLREFLTGDRRKLREELEGRMKQASKKLAFEKAAELRDQIRAIGALEKRGYDPEYLVGDITPIDPQEGLDDLTRALGLARKPRTVEGIDIAQLSGGETVGSLVSFVDGIPFKSGYRRFRIKTVRGIDDFGSIREVVRRRFTRLREEEQVFPDVVLIDGGEAHLACAVGELAKLGMPMPVMLSLAKEEERLFRWTDRPVEVGLGKAAPALRLMMYVRDEAHRFAQHYHHLLRRKAVVGES